jgi:hypothetical protein
MPAVSFRPHPFLPTLHTPDLKNYKLTILRFNQRTYTPRQHHQRHGCRTRASHFSGLMKVTEDKSNPSHTDRSTANVLSKAAKEIEELDDNGSLGARPCTSFSSYQCLQALSKGVQIGRVRAVMSAVRLKR